MKLSCSNRIRIILVLSILIAFQSSIRDIIAESKLYFSTKESNRFIMHDNKFKELTRILPDFSTVGYFTDQDDSELNKLEAFGLTQYALAPVILVNNTEPQLIVAHFYKPININRFCEENNYRLLNDFDNGVMLLSQREE